MDRRLFTKLVGCIPLFGITHFKNHIDKVKEICFIWGPKLNDVKPYSVILEYIDNEIQYNADTMHMCNINEYPKDIQTYNLTMSNLLWKIKNDEFYCVLSTNGKPCGLIKMTGLTKI